MFAYIDTIENRKEEEKRKYVSDDLGRDTKENFYYWDTTNTRETLSYYVHTLVRAYCQPCLDDSNRYPLFNEMNAN